MFQAIKEFFADLSSGGKPAHAFGDDDYRVAVAALLVHAAAVDGRMSEPEHVNLAGMLQRRFALDDAAAQELIEQATAVEREATDLYRFTHLLMRKLDDKARARTVEMMWEIAYTDGNATEFESNLIWRTADLLGVSSNERIALRQRVAAAHGQGGA
ncbi:MAG: TerB family tellurite resistance protein [Alphaproteobacteria bacterium]|nr:TerB family tellurite resistance protein [Alphaproteobacteria bacterium]